jgi:hypothetical protein
MIRKPHVCTAVCMFKICADVAILQRSVWKRKKLRGTQGRLSFYEYFYFEGLVGVFFKYLLGLHCKEPIPKIRDKYSQKRN